MALSAQDLERLESFLGELEGYAGSALGYPAAFDIRYETLIPFLSYGLNNVGDPFIDGSYRLNTHAFEREVLEFFARMTRAPQDQWWGYVTNGGTEGNLYGMYLARELYPDGIVYFSQDSHYSVSKNLLFLGMRHIMIRSQENGEMDYDDLRETVRIRRDVTPIIFANIGTTMKEGKDDISRINAILDDLALERRYVHSDAALCGGFAAYLEPRPSWDFGDGVDSISISGHKFFASPIPCGIVLAKRGHVERIGQAVAYIGSRDTTISGSRNGFTPLILWYAVRSLGVEGIKNRLAKSLQTASYAMQQFRQAGIDAYRNEGALTVVFPRPPAKVCSDWQLATAGEIAHIVCMPHVTTGQVDALLADILASQKKEPQ